MQRLDFINEEMQKEHHAVQTFEDVDQAMKQYYYITGKQLDPLLPEPKLSDYYVLNQSISLYHDSFALRAFVQILQLLVV